MERFKVVIVAKTRMGGQACIGGLTFAGRSLRLRAADEDSNDRANQEYEIGDVWEVAGQPTNDRPLPHSEDFRVVEKRKLPPLSGIGAFISKQMPPVLGSAENLYNGLVQSTPHGALYIAHASGVPDHSTTFWQADHDLIRTTTGKRIRYRYDGENGAVSLVFVGYQDPPETLPAGTLLRVSLAHWWRPQARPEHEARCYVQLSGWFEAEAEGDREPEMGEDGEWELGGWEEWELPLEMSVPFEEEFPAPGFARQDFVTIPPNATPLQLLKLIFGYETFRPLQAEIIDNVLAKRDTLVIMPTGGGKSMCYQLPALLLDGLTVVVSPLISLMQDQVTQLRELGLRAAFLNSTLSHSEYVRVMEQARGGDLALLYMAPETLLRPESLLLLEQSRLEAFVIDEAHCISSWGHDFRPEYRQLVAVRERFPDAVCVALTATATPRVQTDIKQSLDFANQNEFVASFDRPNLHIAVEPKHNTLAQTIDFIASRADQSGIIYCATRKQVDLLTESLAARKVSVLPYHAGLDTRTRQQNQTAFIRDDVNIIVATIAFGMGIDKPNVRFVLHVDLPKNIENYYQQIGRAGRDGLRSDCLLLFGYGDVRTIRYFIDEGAPEERKGREMRLQAIIRWAESGQCRRRQLVAYFGEELPNETCELCDNCLREEEEQVDLTEPAQKFLSCVKRTGELFGISHIVNVLRGSQAKSVMSRNHHRLSTYNIGTEFSADTWKFLARQFIHTGLLTQNQHGSLLLTRQAWDVLRGTEKVLGTMPKIAPATPLSAQALDYDTRLFDVLRRKRKTLADEANVPPYVIFSDQSLIEMATYFPHSELTLSQLHGVGRVKLEKYADIFLPLIRAYCAEQQLQEKPKAPAPTTARRSSAGKPRFEEVGDAYNAGHSLADLMAAFGVKRGTIVAHLEKYVQTGHALDAAQVREEVGVSAETLTTIITHFQNSETDHLRPVYDACNAEVDWDELRLARLIYKIEGFYDKV